MGEVKDKDIHYYLPDGFTERPTTVLGVLRAARATIAEEGRWTKGTDYRIEDPSVDPATPFCDSWQVCARGAVWVVACGVVPAPETTKKWLPLGHFDVKPGPASRIIAQRAMERLSDAAGRYYSVVDYNDRSASALADVMKAFDLAIEKEETRLSNERARQEPKCVIKGREFKTLIPDGFTGYAKDVVDVLRRGRQVIIDEGRWMTGNWFTNAHPEVNPEDPFCNDWRVCAEGAIGIVSIGASRTVGYGKSRWAFELESFIERDQTDWSLYEEAKSYLVKAGLELRPDYLGKYDATRANYWNDAVFKTRTEVIAWFDLAIKLASHDQIHYYLPDGFDKPETVLDALIVGRALLAEEGRWCKGAEYKIKNPDEDPTTPFCDSWSVCSVGALRVALLGIRHKTKEEAITLCQCDACTKTRHHWTIVVGEFLSEARNLFELAVSALDKAVPGRRGIIGLNDSSLSSHAQVLEVWDKAIQTERDRLADEQKAAVLERLLAEEEEIEAADKDND